MIVDGIVEPMELGHLRIKRAPMRTMSAKRDWTAAARKNGGDRANVVDAL